MSGYEAFLTKKRIDSNRFKASMAREWETYRSEFEQLGEAAFDARKKFFLNGLRLQFPLRDKEEGQ